MSRLLSAVESRSNDQHWAAELYCTRYSTQFCLSIPTNPAMISNVWCLEICAGTLFPMLLKFGAVLSTICDFLMAVLYLDPFTAMYCCRAVVYEDAKTMLASGLQALSLERESNTVSQCVRPWIKLTLEYPFNWQTHLKVDERSSYPNIPTAISGWIRLWGVRDQQLRGVSSSPCR